jgi:hypothetical protein
MDLIRPGYRVKDFYRKNKEKVAKFDPQGGVIYLNPRGEDPEFAPSHLGAEKGSNIHTYLGFKVLP